MNALKTSMLPCIDNPALSAMAHGEQSIAYSADCLADEIADGRESARWTARSIAVGEHDLMLHDELVLVLLSQQLELGYVGITSDCSPLELDLPVEDVDLGRIRRWCADHVLHVALGCAVFVLIMSEVR